MSNHSPADTKDVAGTADTAGNMAQAKQPKRERGKQRVAALMNAGAELFQEKGYEAATMTEIAARAGAAIGSLYQFFPSKEALAEAIFARYSTRVTDMLQELAQRSPTLSPADLADALVDTMLALRSDRDATIALSDSVTSIVERRKPLRNATRNMVATILRGATPGLGETRATVVAAMVLHIMKSVQALAIAEKESGQPFVAEARRVLALYISQLR
jgi:AcrR family transcriptional regulator